MFALVLILSTSIQVSQKDIVSVHVPELTIQPGKTGIISILINVKEGYHIQSNKIKDKFLIPAAIEIEDHLYIKTGKAKFPGAKKLKLQGTDKNLEVFNNQFKVTIPVFSTQPEKKGSNTLNALLRYQACNSKSCFAPKTIHFKIYINNG